MVRINLTKLGTTLQRNKPEDNRPTDAVDVVELEPPELRPEVLHQQPQRVLVEVPAVKGEILKAGKPLQGADLQQ